MDPVPVVISFEQAESNLIRLQKFGQLRGSTHQLVIHFGFPDESDDHYVNSTVFLHRFDEEFNGVTFVAQNTISVCWNSCTDDPVIYTTHTTLDAAHLMIVTRKAVDTAIRNARELPGGVTGRVSCSLQLLRTSGIGGYVEVPSAEERQQAVEEARRVRNGGTPRDAIPTPSRRNDKRKRVEDIRLGGDDSIEMMKPFPKRQRTD